MFFARKPETPLPVAGNKNRNIAYVMAELLFVYEDQSIGSRRHFKV